VELSEPWVEQSGGSESKIGANNIEEEGD